MPAVLDKLVELAQSAVPDGWVVFDGPTRDMDTKPCYVLLGWSGQPDTRGVDVEVNRTGANQRTEVIDVRGAVQASFGDDGQKKARDAAYAVLNDFEAAASGRLDVRGVSKSELTHHAVEPYIGNGAGCVVMFTIHIEGAR